MFCLQSVATIRLQPPLLFLYGTAGNNSFFVYMIACIHFTGHTQYKKESHLSTVCFHFLTLIFFYIFTLTLLLQTGDKSSEETARMNLSDLRLVVGLKSNASVHHNIFRNVNSSGLAASLQSYPHLSGKSSVLIFHSIQVQFWNTQQYVIFTYETV